MTTILFNNRKYEVVEKDSLPELTAKHTGCDFSLVVKGKRGAMKLFFMDSKSGQLFEKA
jgi:hypothetical protein